MAKTDPINPNTPAGSEDPKLGDDRIRGLKRGVLELFGYDHYIGDPNDDGEYDEDEAGRHKWIRFWYNESEYSEPPAETNTAFFYINKIEGEDGVEYLELFYKDEDGNKIQLTKEGSLYAGSLLRIIGSTATLELTDSDQTAPEGRFRLRVTGNSVILYEKMDEDPETWQDIITFSRDSDITLGNITSYSLNQGNCTATNGDATLTRLTGDSWTSLLNGKTIAIGGVSYTISSVTDINELELTASYTGTSGTKAYTITGLQRNIKNLADPEDNQDAATKVYVDNAQEYLTKIPRWRVKSDNSNGLTQPSQFDGDIATFDIISLGSILGFNNSYAYCPSGSNLFEMKVNCVTATNLTLKLFYVDDAVYVYVDNVLQSSRASGYDGRTTPLSLSISVPQGESTIQIVQNNSGGGGGALCFGCNIIDFDNITYIGF